jgi:hypothetical protein
MLTGCCHYRRELVSFCGLAFDIHGWLCGIAWSLGSGVLPLLLVVLSGFWLFSRLWYCAGRFGCCAYA